MKGLLIHNTRSIDKILESHKLIPKKNLEEKPDVDWDGPDDIPLLFFSLMFEDKTTLVNKSSLMLFWRNTIFFDSQLLEDYGKKKFKFKKLYKDFFINKHHSEKPETKVWFNTSWSHGKFNTSENDNFSVNYDPSISIKKNIKIFHDAKVLSVENNNLKYDTRYDNFKHQNEVVVYDETIEISRYILGIYIEKDILREKLKKQYPQYNIMDKSETNKFIKNYF